MAKVKKSAAATTKKVNNAARVEFKSSEARSSSTKAHDGSGHDGIIEPNEITVGSTPVFFGNSQPSDEYSITPAVTLFRFLRLSALFDRRAGIMVYNGTEEFRCGFANTICQEAYDPKVGLKRQAAAITESIACRTSG